MITEIKEQIKYQPGEQVNSWMEWRWSGFLRESHLTKAYYFTITNRFILSFNKKLYLFLFGCGPAQWIR